MKLLPVTRQTLPDTLSDARVEALIENAPATAAEHNYNVVCENNEICLHPQKNPLSAPLIHLILKPVAQGTDVVLTFAFGKVYQILILILAALCAIGQIALIVLDLWCKITPNLFMVLPLMLVCICLIAALIVSNCANCKAAAKVLHIIQDQK